jgi:putative transposase
MATNHNVHAIDDFDRGAIHNEIVKRAYRFPEAFVHWYNEAHRHSAIRHVTSAERHAGQDTAILAARDRVYHAARRANPGRWS